MTIWTAAQIGRIWLNNGGASNHVQIAKAVSLAESGGNDHAISPSNDYGLWQINSANFDGLGVSPVTVLDPNINARCAIRMSGNGTNWAAWCTCWVDPGPNCGHGWLPGPQRGSPAWNVLVGIDPAVAASVATGSGTPNLPGTHQAGQAWATVGSFVGTWGRSRWRDLHAAGDQARVVR